MIQSLRYLVVLGLLSSFVACERRPQTTGEKVENKVNDALDRRPGENVRDAAENTKDAVKDAVK